MIAGPEKSLLGKRRSDVKIIVEILRVASNGVNKTQIVYKADLNFKQARKYLDFLIKKELIAVSHDSNGKEGYKTTDRGRNFVRRYVETVELIA
jgi:predicted transcriptional regulator